VSEIAKPVVERRHSVAREPEIIADPIKFAEAEAANGLRQFDFGREAAQAAIDRLKDSDQHFRLRPSLILSLHRTALEGISGYAGNYRPAGVSIKDSQHTPPGAHLVPELVEDMCDYVNEHWSAKTPIHLAAYVMWRLNWIHPFADGNGRTARITSYVAMMIKSGFILPGSPTIPDQIVSDRRGYFDALDKAERFA
jgi:Fic family protein